MMLLKGKNIILTGAGRGIGQAIALKCAGEGASLALLSRTLTELEETLQLIKSFSPGSESFPVDISDSSGLGECFNHINNHFNGIDVLINNAGIQHPIGLFHQNDFILWKKNIEVNLFGTANLIHLVLPGMVSKHKGKIINMSGGGATGPRPNFSAYAVAKTAIVRLTENLAEEYKDSGIDINALAPGAVNTKMLDEVLSARENAGKEFCEAEKRREKGGTDPESAANLVVFLASELSDGITGKLISAPWDPWVDSKFQEELRNQADLGTLRRIDNKYFFKKL